jgi:hypothetical protein
MKGRLLQAKQRGEGSPSGQPLKSLEFDAAAFEDLAWWVKQDPTQALRIIKFDSRNAMRTFFGRGQA